MHDVIDGSRLTALYEQHVSRLTAAYDAALRTHGFDGVVIHSGSLQKKSRFDDQMWPFVPVPHFRHWLPLEVADCAVLVVPGRAPQLLLNTARDFWENEKPRETDHFWKAFQVTEVSDVERMRDHFEHRGRIAFLGEDTARASVWSFTPEQVAPSTLVNALDALRTRKTPYEMLCLAEANRRAALGHRAVLERFAAGDDSELDLHLAYLGATRQDDPETPYKNIVALGEHAATLHHVSYGKRSSGAQSLLLDAGATFQGYDSDITRTAVKGTSDGAARFQSLVAKLNELQLELCGRVRIGKMYEELHNECHELLAPVLRDTGIVNAVSDGELVDSGITRLFLPHGLGHSLGIQTHDVGCAQIRPEPRNPFLRNTSRIEAGQVFTIEPGCYFIGSLLNPLRNESRGACINWSVVQELSRFGGVRIEDDLVVRDDGSVDNLTRTVLP